MRPTTVQKLNLLALLVLALTYPGQNRFQRLVVDSAPPKVLNASVSLKPFELPLPIRPSAPRNLTAQAVVVFDPDSGTLLYSKQLDLPLHPASTTKIMTALVALDHFKLTDVLTVKTADRAIGNTMKLIPGDKLTFIDLLQGLLIASANDAAVALAENYPGGYSAFVEAMNHKATDLRLLNTHYTNVSGIEGQKHKTTALDLAILTKEAVKNDLFAQIVSTPRAQVTDISTDHVYNLSTTNKLLGQVPGLVGVKTGWTENAGECLVSLTKRDNHRIITVVLNSTDRFGETENLINWAFTNYRWVTYTPSY